MTVISSLRPDDWAQAYQIECHSHAFPWSEQLFRQNQGDRFLNLRIDTDDKMAGFAVCQVLLDEASLFNLAIDPPFQRRGLGRKLLTELTVKLLCLDVLTLWLEVRASNLPAIHLYQSLEFNEVSRRQGYYPTPDGREDAILMALTL